MNPKCSPSLEDVLDAYALEADNNNATLERYLREYPQYAGELVDLSRELDRPADVSTAPLDAAERAFIDAAWKQFASAAGYSDPLIALEPTKMKSIAQALRVPRQILSAFRERRVKVNTVPAHFLEKLATALGTPCDILCASLARPPNPAMSHSYKSEEKPEAPQQIAFEQLLVEACVTPEERTVILENKT